MNILVKKNILFVQKKAWLSRWDYDKGLSSHQLTVDGAGHQLSPLTAEDKACQVQQDTHHGQQHEQIHLTHRERQREIDKRGKHRYQ